MLNYCRIRVNSRSKRSASQIRARVVASVVRSRASLQSTAFIAGGSRMLSWAVLSWKIASWRTASKSVWFSIISDTPASKDQIHHWILSSRIISLSLASLLNREIFLLGFFISGTSDSAFSVLLSWSLYEILVACDRATPDKSHGDRLHLGFFRITHKNRRVRTGF